jgi:hypothetical protein
MQSKHATTELLLLLAALPTNQTREKITILLTKLQDTIVHAYVQKIDIIQRLQLTPIKTTLLIGVVSLILSR